MSEARFYRYLSISLGESGFDRAVIVQADIRKSFEQYEQSDRAQFDSLITDWWLDLVNMSSIE